MARAGALVAPAGALLAATVALVCLALRWQERHSAGPLVVMGPATALGILLAASSLLLLRSPRESAWRHRLGSLAGAATGVLGAVFAWRYAAEWHTGLAEAVFDRWGGFWWAQRPSPVTCAGLILLGGALVALGTQRLRHWADAGASAALFVALTALIGHAYGASALYGLNRWGGTAVSTAASLGAIALGIVFADETRGMAAAIVSEGPAGHFLCRLLPAALLGPPLFGLLIRAAERAALVDAAFGTALFVVLVTVLITGHVLRQGQAVHAMHVQREQLLAQEREVSDRVTNILESVTDAFFTVDTRWRFTYVNREAERLLRRSRGELLGRDLWQEFPEAAGSIFQREYRRAMAERKTVQFEGRYPPLDAWFDVRAYPAASGLSVYFRDVTARRRAQERLRESEERFRTLAENATMAIFVIDASSTIEFANPAVERIFGYARAEMVGRSLAMLMPEDQRPLHDAGVRRYLESGRRNISWEGVELPGLTRDGRVVPLEISFGEFVREGRRYFTGIARDISERKQSEAAMRESEERFRALANSLPQLAWMADPSGWIYWYNQRWHEYTGTTHEEVEGWNWRKLHHPAHVERVVSKIRRAFETGEQWEDTFPLRSKTGEYRWFLSRALPIRDAEGHVLRWLGTNTDITGQMEAAAERERLLAKEQEARAEADRRRVELERVTESRARLIRGFSHDVRNPLGVIDAQAWILEDGQLFGALNDKQWQSVQRIRRSIRTSLGLIEDLLELARAEAGQIELNTVDTDVGQLAREAADDFQAHALGVGLALEVRAPQGLRTGTDPVRVRQVLGNLLSNAVKYAPQGHVTVDAALRQAGGPRPGEWIAVSVIDSGPGIPKDKVEQIFHEFTRLEPHAQQGLGIGLAISRRIAQLLGGDLAVESEVGRGSAFTLWLPMRRAVVTRAGQPSAAGAAGA